MRSLRRGSMPFFVLTGSAMPYSSLRFALSSWVWCLVVPYIHGTHGKSSFLSCSGLSGGWASTCTYRIDILAVGRTLTSCLRYEWKPPAFCKEVSVPPHIFGNRTSVAGFYIDFVSSMLLQWVAFFWPVYFQGARGTSPLKAGLYFIPFEAFLLTTAVIGGGLLTKLGHYRPLHLFGFVLSTIGPGLNIMLSDSTPKVVWAWFQIVDSIGRGILLPTTLPAIMASLPDSDAAAVTGMFSFLRSFGFVWVSCRNIQSACEAMLTFSGRYHPRHHIQCAIRPSLTSYQR
jgi:hypothetical protein